MEWDSDSLSLAGILAFRGNFAACSLSPCALGAARPPRRPLTGPLPAGRCWLLSHRGGHSWASHSWCLAVQLYAGIVFIMQQAPARCTPSRRYLQPPSCKKKNTSPTLKPSLLPSPALLRQPSLCLINPMACRAPPPAKHAHTHHSPRMQARSRAEITAPARTAVAAERLLPLRPSKSGSCLGFQGPGSSVSPPQTGSMRHGTGPSLTHDHGRFLAQVGAHAAETGVEKRNRADGALPGVSSADRNTPAGLERGLRLVAI